MASRSTIRDVAQAAGVSVSTVSRVFTRPELFREETRDRVHRAAAALNYTPNRSAAALTTGRTGAVGVIVPSLLNPLFPEMVKAAQHTAREHDLAVILGDSDDDGGEEERLVRTLGRDTDGLLLFTSLMSDEQIRAVAPPMSVFVNRRVEGRCGVVVDARQGMRLTCQYLVNLGHTALLYLAGPDNSWSARDRQDALLEAAVEAGIEATLVGPNPPTFESGLLAAERLLTGRLPTAVVCFSDVMAMGLTTRLLALGVGVPERVSVVGWGGSTLTSQTTPALTTVSMPLRDLGDIAMRELLALRETPPGQAQPRTITLPVTLTARATTTRASHH